jgi:excisionase family DNA binding protein
VSQVKEMLKPSDIAPLLGVTRARVYQMVTEGKLPSVRFGRGLRIPRAAWEAWLEEQSKRALASIGGGQVGNK